MGITNKKLSIQMVPDGYASDKCNYGEKAGRRAWQPGSNASNLN
jgi:hypothetical protein